MSELKPFASKRAFYFPIDRKLYEVAPGLKPLGFDFGNGTLDQNVFQIDDDFPRYRSEKLASRAEDLSKYHAVSKLSPRVEASVVQRIVEHLLREWPQYFRLEKSAQVKSLECALTSETLSFDSSWKLIDVVGGPTPPYVSALDALMMQVQEDAAILSGDPVNDSPGNWLSMLHILLPSHWDPREKIGHDFASFHKPVPGFEKMAKAQHQLADAMINKGPFVRFVWSFVTDTRLNHHPSPPPDADPVKWRGRAFNAGPDTSPFHLRIERQTILSLPDVRASLFLIRLSFIEGEAIRKDNQMREQLVGALESMTPAARTYKGVADCYSELTNWLKS